MLELFDKGLKEATTKMLSHCKHKRKKRQKISRRKQKDTKMKQMEGLGLLNVITENKNSVDRLKNRTEKQKEIHELEKRRIYIAQQVNKREKQTEENVQNNRGMDAYNSRPEPRAMGILDRDGVGWYDWKIVEKIMAKKFMDLAKHRNLWI